MTPFLFDAIRTDLKIVRPFLWLLFHFFRLLVRISLLTQFNQLVLLGRKNLHQINRPTIIAVNHPSTMMDVFITAPFLPRVLFFLANYSLFKHPITNWLLRRLYSIPIKRKEDVGPDGNLDNEKAFEQSYQHLEKGGALFVAPEGVSWNNRFIRPLKTGTARIALGVEARQNGSLGLQIIPIGLSYLPNQNAIVQIGQPLVVKDWLPAYLLHPTETVQSLTQSLENALQNLILDTQNESGEKAVNQLETILQNEFPVSPKQQFFRSQSLLPLFLQNTILQEQLENWFQTLQAHQLSDAGIAKKYHPVLITLLFLFSPVFLLFKTGCLFLGCNVHLWILKRFNIYPGYGSTIKLLFNTFVSFPLLLLLTSPYLAGWQHFFTCLLLAIIGTHFNRYYQQAIHNTLAIHKFKKLPLIKQEQLVQQRKELVEKVNNLLTP